MALDLAGILRHFGGIRAEKERRQPNKRGRRCPQTPMATKNVN